MPRKKIDLKQTSTKQRESELIAFISVFLLIIGFIVAIVSRRDDKYVMFYASQSLVLFLYAVIIGIIDGIILSLFTSIMWIFIIVLWIYTWINALSGEKKYTIFLKEFSKKINL